LSLNKSSKKPPKRKSFYYFKELKRQITEKPAEAGFFFRWIKVTRPFP